MIAIIPLLVAIAGLLLFALATTEKPVEIGRALMTCGFLVTLFTAAGFTMRLTPVLPLVIAVAGVLIYVLAKAKPAEIGRALMWCGTLVTLFAVATHTYRVL